MTIDQVAIGFTDLAESGEDRFNVMATAVLTYQRASNLVYGRYCKAIEQQLPTERRLRTLPPFLPVAAFKEAMVTSFPPAEADRVFESSRTGRDRPSKHYVRDLSIYERSIAVHFEMVFGVGPFLIASHLPGYAERGCTSSLLHMVEYLMDRFGAPGSGSILGAPDRLRQLAERSRESGTRLIVFGAAFGLLSVVEETSFALPPETIVLETGGMKTHRREIGRGELHRRLAQGFGLDASAIRSEYGMCELMSQCYTGHDGAFYPPPWMRMWVVDPASPFEELEEGEIGALALLDLANVHSASALITEDRAVRRGEGFDVLGRLSGAELRGCNFLLEHV